MPDARGRGWPDGRSTPQGLRVASPAVGATLVAMGRDLPPAAYRPALSGPTAQLVSISAIKSAKTAGTAARAVHSTTVTPPTQTATAHRTATLSAR